HTRERGTLAGPALHSSATCVKRFRVGARERLQRLLRARPHCASVPSPLVRTCHLRERRRWGVDAGSGSTRTLRRGTAPWMISNSGARGAAVEFRVLGPLEVWDDAGAPIDVRRSKARTLLLALRV